MTLHVYHPNFQLECYLCGSSPCVIVTPHDYPQTKLCGPHFFHNSEMNHWEDWNEQSEEPIETDRPDSNSEEADRETPE